MIESGHPGARESHRIPREPGRRRGGGERVVPEQHGPATDLRHAIEGRHGVFTGNAPTAGAHGEADSDAPNWIACGVTTNSTLSGKSSGLIG